jgi:pimeloyl-ACP methyl ester carboxylesterase
MPLEPAAAVIARRLGRRFGLPMFFLQGVDDRYSVTDEVRRYAREIEAPHIELVTIDGAGHSVMLLRGDLLAAVERYVRPWHGRPHPRAG